MTLALDMSQSFPRVENIDIKLLSLLEKNPRRISKDQMEKLCNSLKSDPDYLYNRPVLVHETDGKYVVYAGNQRVRAAQKLKWKVIPCIVEKGLSEETLKRRIITDNLHQGSFDFDMLCVDYDVDTLLELGFSEKELHIDIFDQDDKENKNKKKKQCKMCPQCGFEFD